MFASHVQIAENGMAQRQYKATMDNKFPSKPKAFTSESTPVDFSWYHLFFLTHKTQN